jgi:hypothetical protein
MSILLYLVIARITGADSYFFADVRRHVVQPHLLRVVCLLIERLLLLIYQMELIRNPALDGQYAQQKYSDYRRKNYVQTIFTDGSIEAFNKKHGVP